MTMLSYVCVTPTNHIVATLAVTRNYHLSI